MVQESLSPDSRDVGGERGGEQKGLVSCGIWGFEEVGGGQGGWRLPEKSERGGDRLKGRG